MALILASTIEVIQEIKTNGKDQLKSELKFSVYKNENEKNTIKSLPKNHLNGVYSTVLIDCLRAKKKQQ